MPADPGTRRFTLVDLMALVAAAAASFGIVRAWGFTDGRVTIR